MSSNIEEEILAIERELYTLPSLPSLRQRLVALEQGVSQSWSGVGFQGPPPATTNDFPNICPNIPIVLTVVDSLTGTYTITYDHANLWWLGCKIYARPLVPGVPCTARNIPVWFQLRGDDSNTNWDMYIWWFAPNNGSVCPTTGKTCADNVFGTGGLFRSTICGVTCTAGVFKTNGEMDWVNQNQVGPPGTASIFTVQ